MGWDGKRGVHVIATIEHRIGTFFIPFFMKRINCEDFAFVRGVLLVSYCFPEPNTGVVLVIHPTRPMIHPSSFEHTSFSGSLVVQLHQMDKKEW